MVLGRVHALLIFSVLVPVLMISIPEALAAPGITLDKDSGPPGTSVKVTGTSWDPFDFLSLIFGSTPIVIGTVTADGSGAFTITVTIPSTAEIGAHTIGVTNFHTAVALPFTVTSPVSIPEFPFPFGLVIMFVAVAAMYVAIRQKMIPGFKHF